MSGSRVLLTAAAVIILTGVAIGFSQADGQSAPAAKTGDGTRYGFGVAPSPDELSRFFAVKPDGRDLPSGRGTYSQRQTVYADQCAACHGDKMQGWSRGMMMAPEMAAVGDGRLVGGRGSLGAPIPVFTVESYWPYATTLWDYIKRTMPQVAPGSLSDNDVYALVAYILGEANVVPKSAVMDAQSLAKVVMPNNDGFVEGRRPQPDPSRQATPPETSPTGGNPAMMPRKMP